MPPSPPAPVPHKARPAPPKTPANPASPPSPSPSSASKTSMRSPTSRTTSWPSSSPSTPRNSSPSSASPSLSRLSSAPRASKAVSSPPASNESLDSGDNPMVMMNPDLVAGDLEITRAQNRNYLLGEGFLRCASKSNSWSLLLRYQAQAERHGAPSGPRAAEEFERLKALREELPNEPIFEAQPEQTETTCTPSETNPSPPENPTPAPGPPASAPELTLDLAGAPGILEDREVEARHPGSAPVPLPDREAPLAD